MQTVPPLEDVLSGEEERKTQGRIFFFFFLPSFLVPLQKSSSGSSLVSLMRRELSLKQEPTGGCVMWVFVAWICERSEERQHPGSGIIPALNMPCLSYLISSIWRAFLRGQKTERVLCQKSVLKLKLLHPLKLFRRHSRTYSLNVTLWLCTFIERRWWKHDITYYFSPNAPRCQTSCLACRQPKCDCDLLWRRSLIVREIFSSSN